MSDDRLAALLARLAALTLDERVAFVRWANEQPPAPSDHAHAYSARAWSDPEHAAVAAFSAWVEDRDRVAAAGPISHLMFDPCFPDTGWRAWDWVRALAIALASGDDAAIARVSPALHRLGLPDAPALPSR